MKKTFLFFSFFISVVVFSAYSDSVIVEINNLSDNIWKTYPNPVSSSHKYLQDCKTLNAKYKNGGFKCGFDGKYEDFEGFKLPKNFNDVLNHIASSKYTKAENCSKFIKLYKNNNGEIDIKFINRPSNVTKVLNYNISTEKQRAIRGELIRKYKAFFDTYRCKPGTGTMSDGGIIGAPIFRFYSINSDQPYEDIKTKVINLLKENSNIYLEDSSEDLEETLMRNYRKNSKFNYFFTDVLHFSYNCPVYDSPTFSCPPIELSSVFKPNSWEISGDLWEIAVSDANPMKRENQIALKCIDLSKNLKIKRILIKASSNSISNSGNLCAKDFLGLSKKRAESVKIFVTNNLRQKGYYVDDEVFLLDYFGDNGDGTSGPCAYTVTKNVIGEGDKDKDINYVMGGEDKKKKELGDLAKYRSANFTITFERASTNKKAYEYLTSSYGTFGFGLKNVKFSCITKDGETVSVPDQMF